MQISTLRELCRNEFTAFAWDQWAQIGVFAPSRRNDTWVIDPEALILFSLEVGRTDPRLFDEVLDWLLLNERLISVQRLRNLCMDDEDRRLVTGALAWVAQRQPRARFSSAKQDPTPNTLPLFRDFDRPISHPDEAFLAAGLLKPATEPSLKSREPDANVPSAFAFRVRLMFGVGSRAEVVRYLLTTTATDVSAQLVAEASAFAKRNVNDTLAALAAAGVVTVFEQKNEHRYYMDRAAWGSSIFRFTPETWPRHREWPQLLRALRRVARWLESPDLDGATSYIAGSRGRDLLEEIERDLAFARARSIALPPKGPTDFDDVATSILDAARALNTWFE